MPLPPSSSIQPSGAFTSEEALDVLAYIFATNAPTSQIQWIVGDIGMGPPPATEPFGYISLFNETILWQTAQGGRGGLATGASRGLDNWAPVITLTVCFAKHDWAQPIQAAPPAGSPVSAAALGQPPPFMEQPLYRLSHELNEGIKIQLRENITVQGELATMRIGESRYVLVIVDGQQYRASRLTLQAQQRRPRGN